MRRYSKTGWVLKGEKEAKTLEDGGFAPEHLREMLANCVHPTKALAMDLEGGYKFEFVEVERVRVSVTVDVERI
jgi:hypothetical protein